jgi:hypothetical protein
MPAIAFFRKDSRGSYDFNEPAFYHDIPEPLPTRIRLELPLAFDTPIFFELRQYHHSQSWSAYIEIPPAGKE